MLYVDNVCYIISNINAKKENMDRYEIEEVKETNQLWQCVFYAIHIAALEQYLLGHMI